MALHIETDLSPAVGSSITLSNRCGVRRVDPATPPTLGTCRWTRLQLVTYKLAMLFGLTTRKRIASSGLCSPTVGSSLSYGRLVSTLPAWFASRCRWIGW